MARLRFVLLLVVLLIAGHDATSAIANGVGGLSAALRDTGHVGYWTPTVLLVTVLAGGAAALVLWRRGRLQRQLRVLGLDVGRSTPETSSPLRHSPLPRVGRHRSA